MEKESTSFRLTHEAKQLLERLAHHLGISQSAAVELAIRRMAQQEGIPR